MINRKLYFILLLLILLLIPSAFPEVTTITSSNQNPDQKLSTELLISSTIKKEFGIAYETIQSDMMEEIQNAQNYADKKIEESNAKLSLFYFKVILSLSLINLISIIFAQFIVFKLRAKELEYLRLFTQQSSNKENINPQPSNTIQRNNKSKQDDLDKQINEISDDLKKLNNDKNQSSPVPKPEFKKQNTDDIVSIDNL